MFYISYTKKGVGEQIELSFGMKTACVKAKANTYQVK